MGATCCTSRSENNDNEEVSVRRHHSRVDSWSLLPEAEERYTFFECAETEEELMAGRKSWPVEQSSSVTRGRTASWTTRIRKEPLRLATPNVDACEAGSMPMPAVCGGTGDVASSPRPRFLPDPDVETFGAGTGETLDDGIDQAFEDNISSVIEAVKALFKERIEDNDLDEELEEQISAGFPELEEWTSLETVSRMLRASLGDPDVAVTMLTKAIESRVRRRELFQTMRCNVVCDMRVIGWDKEHRPVIYLCAQSQRVPVSEMIPQVFLAFEAAVRLSRVTGQVVLIADMHNFSTRLNMDPYAFKDLANSFGTVYADRLNFLLIVDFSFWAQTFWNLCKPMLSERTQNKICFVNEAKAQAIARERFEAPTCDRILSTFDINRDCGSTEDERVSHAQRTAICDVPLGDFGAIEEGS